MSTKKGRLIAEKRKLTKERRLNQVCHIIKLKVNKSRLNNDQKEKLKMIFVEGKWCYNYLLNLSQDEDFNIFDFKAKDLSDITHKDKDGNDVNVHLSNIGSSMKLAIVEHIRSSIEALSTNKKKGRKIGKLKFKSDYKSIELKQYDIVYRIESHNRIRIQGIKKPLPVNGLKQIEKYGTSYDIANAYLIKQDDDYYINITVYYNKEGLKTKKSNYKNEQIGIDFGCQTTFTLSDGFKMDAAVEETDHLKKLNKKLYKQEKGSNNRNKTIKKIHKEYYRLDCKKDDAANKIVHKLLEENKQIIIQDEQLNTWKKRHGKKIQHGILGRVKERLIQHSNQVVVLNRFVPTTKFCRDCGQVHTDIKLWDREFVCPHCGVVYDRDVHAAENMVWLYNNIKHIGAGGSDFKRVEFDEEVCRLFDGLSNRTANHEDAKSLA